jgi:mono/diheme cytochrome c family protein
MVAALSVWAAGCIDEDLLNPMAARQPRVQAYQLSSFYPNEIAMRHPPAGTVPRERPTLKPGMTDGRVRTADGKEAFLASIPVPVDEKLMALGQKRYNHTCGTCHGPLGDGDSPVARQMALRPPPSLHDYADRPAGYIFEVVTKGFGMMASYQAELPVTDRWAVVAYVRALQLAHAGSMDDAPGPERARLQQEARP